MKTYNETLIILAPLLHSWVSYIALSPQGAFCFFSKKPVWRVGHDGLSWGLTMMLTDSTFALQISPYEHEVQDSLVEIIRDPAGDVIGFMRETP